MHKLTCRTIYEIRRSITQCTLGCTKMVKIRINNREGAEYVLLIGLYWYCIGNWIAGVIGQCKTKTCGYYAVIHSVEV